MIPYQWEALNDRLPGAERSGTVHNFQVAAGEKQGEFYGLWFQDSDLAKWLEAASFSLATHPDAKLDAELDGIIATIAKAQQPDGYLDTYVQLTAPDKKWTNLFEWHELYIAGHFIEAGVAHFEATGKRTLLDVVCKLADMIGKVFGSAEGQILGYPGHEEVELALIKLARVTGVKRYVHLAAYFINQRGAKPNYYEDESKRLGVSKKLPVYFYHNRWLTCRRTNRSAKNWSPLAIPCGQCISTRRWLILPWKWGTIRCARRATCFGKTSAIFTPT